MPKFFNKLKKTLFLAHFWPIFLILGHKFFFWKIKLCQAQLHMGFQDHAKIKKKSNDTILRKQQDKQKDRMTKGCTDPILEDPSG